MKRQYCYRLFLGKVILLISTLSQAQIVYDQEWLNQKQAEHRQNIRRLIEFYANPDPVNEAIYNMPRDAREQIISDFQAELNQTMSDEYQKAFEREKALLLQRHSPDVANTILAQREDQRNKRLFELLHQPNSSNSVGDFLSRQNMIYDADRANHRAGLPLTNGGYYYSAGKNLLTKIKTTLFRKTEASWIIDKVIYSSILDKFSISATNEGSLRGFDTVHRPVLYVSGYGGTDYRYAALENAKYQAWRIQRALKAAGIESKVDAPKYTTQSRMSYENEPTFIHAERVRIVLNLPQNAVAEDVAKKLEIVLEGLLKQSLIESNGFIRGQREARKAAPRASEVKDNTSDATKLMCKNIFKK